MSDFDLSNYDPVLPANSELGMRHDQTGMTLFNELIDSANPSKQFYLEGKYQESYDALQEVAATAAELFKGFGLQPDHVIGKR